MFTNSFAFMNRGEPLFAQNNRLMEETNFVQLEGEAATKWSGNTNLPDAVMSKTSVPASIKVKAGNTL
jgi:hypothetical protein